MAHLDTNDGSGNESASGPIGPQALNSLLAAALAERTRQPPQAPQSQPRSRSLLARLILHTVNLLVAAAAFTAYLHFHLQQQTTPATICLVAAGLFAFAPVRALLREILTLERKAAHLVHAVGGLGLAGLAVGGYVSGGPVLSHAALAPFQIMGAAQAIMHQQHPRNARQAEALRRFATSLPEVEQFTSARNLTSPDNVTRAIRVLSDLISKAQSLGETELEADPGFQSALRQATTRVGLTLGLDAVDQGINRVAARSDTSSQVAELRKRLARARQTIASH